MELIKLKLSVITGNTSLVILLLCTSTLNFIVFNSVIGKFLNTFKYF